MRVCFDETTPSRIVSAVWIADEVRVHKHIVDAMVNLSGLVPEPIASLDARMT